MDIRQRLHLSGMDSHAPELARKWGLGLEVTDFCYAPMLDDPATLPAVREKMAGIDHFWLHAPFAELAPCAVDPLVREVTARRYRQALSAARQLGIRRLVIHSGYIPLVYFPEWFTEQSVAFWREFLPEVPEDMVLSLRRFISRMASSPSEIILSSSGLPVGWDFSSTSSTTSLQKMRAMRNTTTDAAAAIIKWPGLYRGSSRAYSTHTTAAAYMGAADLCTIFFIARLRF